jgi:hypothetical protein
MPVPLPRLLNLNEAASHVAERCAVGVDEAESALERAVREASLTLYSEWRPIELHEKDQVDFQNSRLVNLAAGYVIRVQVNKAHVDTWLSADDRSPPGNRAPPSPHRDRPVARPEGPMDRRVPDWTYWLHVPDVSPVEAVALSLDIDPKSLSIVQGVHGRSLRGVPEAEAAEFAKRLDLTKRNIGPTLVVMNGREHQRGEEPKIRLKRFATWAAQIEWLIPAELAALAGPESAVSSPPIPQEISDSVPAAPLVQSAQDTEDDGAAREEGAPPSGLREFVAWYIQTERDAECTPAKKWLEATCRAAGRKGPVGPRRPTKVWLFAASHAAGRTGHREDLKVTFNKLMGDVAAHEKGRPKKSPR